MKIRVSRSEISLLTSNRFIILPEPGGAFDLEVVAVVQVEVQQRPDDQRVHRHPDRAAPVGVAAEHAGVRLGRQVVHPVLLAVDVEDVRMLLVELRDRADAVGAQELVLVEHLRENPAEPLRVDQGQQSPARPRRNAPGRSGASSSNSSGIRRSAFLDVAHRPRNALPLPLLDHRGGAQRAAAPPGNAP